MSRSLKGKVALVTGAAGGMGRAYALRLAELGADLAIVDIDLATGYRYGELTADSVEEEVRALGRRAIGVEVDLAHRAGADEAINRTVAELGRLDIIVNNAGGMITPVERSTASLSPDEDIEKLIGANLMSTIYCCQAAARVLPRPGGVIVNIATTGVQLASSSARHAIYSSAKAAVIRFTKHLAVELGPDGIRANCIAPGLIATPRVASTAAERGIGTAKQAATIPLRRLGNAGDMTGTLEYLVTDMSSYVTGECITVSGGRTLVSAGGESQPS